MIKALLVGLCLILAPYLAVMGLWEFIAWGGATWNISQWKDGSRLLLSIGYVMFLWFLIDMKGGR